MGISLNCFPSSREEALVMLYLQSQDLVGKSMSEIHTMYWDALDEIRKDMHRKEEAGFTEDFVGSDSMPYILKP